MRPGASVPHTGRVSVSLVGFSAKNHPQQAAVRGPRESVEPMAHAYAYFAQECEDDRAALVLVSELLGRNRYDDALGVTKARLATRPEPTDVREALEIVDGVLYSIDEGTGSAVTKKELHTIRRALTTATRENTP